MAELVFFRRGEEVLRVGLSEGRTVVGRGDKCDISLPDPEISRTHAALTLSGLTCEVEDLSGKGCLIAGKKVYAGTLTDGMDIAFGKWRAIFRPRSTVEVDVTDAGDKTEIAATETGQSEVRIQVRVESARGSVSYKPKDDAFSIGTDSSNSIVLKHKFISARHLKVVRNGARFDLSDHHSTNGTWIGETRIHEASVPLFTTLRLGECEVTIEPQGADKKAPTFHGIIGSDPSIKQLAEIIDRVGNSNAPVTILGDSGTGKELVAAALHKVSARRDKDFIPVNCGAISKDLIESELFGHEKGAFTGALNARKGAFEEADGGTIFLDEIGELPLELQAKLLRVLESGEVKRVGSNRPIRVDVRIIAATNRDLLRLSREGRYREDLFYRICVVPVTLPPLRNRKGDIVTLAKHFILAFSPKGRVLELTQGAIEKLEKHNWPGNIRELRNVIHRALLLRKGANIDADDLAFDQEREVAPNLRVPRYDPSKSLAELLAQAREYFMQAAVEHFGNNKKAVTALKISSSNAYKKQREARVEAFSEDPEEGA